MVPVFLKIWHMWWDSLLGNWSPAEPLLCHTEPDRCGQPPCTMSVEDHDSQSFQRFHYSVFQVSNSLSDLWSYCLYLNLVCVCVCVGAWSLAPNPRVVSSSPHLDLAVVTAQSHFIPIAPAYLTVKLESGFGWSGKKGSNIQSHWQCRSGAVLAIAWFQDNKCQCTGSECLCSAHSACVAPRGPGL